MASLRSTSRCVTQAAPLPWTLRVSEHEAISLLSLGVDFGIAQLVDGNWGTPSLKKSLFAGPD